MKNLLYKSLKPLMVYSFVVFAISIPSYFLVVDWIWLKELNENNELIAQRIENKFNSLKISTEKLEESILFWNQIQSVGRIDEGQMSSNKDSVYTVRRQNTYSPVNEIDRFRGLKRNIHINGNDYTLTIETNVEESEETVGYLAVITLLFFLILIVGFLMLNKKISTRLWQPFRNTLAKLKTFNLNNQAPIEFEPTEIIEFEELNAALSTLLESNINAYKSQKEFTENASHELQTPLAIIKNKLDLLLQKEIISDRQYELIEEINRALTRVTRINKNLLLLAKIENHQFEIEETIDLGEVVEQCLLLVMEHADNKNIAVATNIAEDVYIKGNKTLIEILFNNLLINAIRHNHPNGYIAISLDDKRLTIANSGEKALDGSAIFGRFSSASKEHAGSGLGLAIVSEVCKVHTWKVQYGFDGASHNFTISF